ncbi:MAG: site-specific integrase [Methanoregula sp.]
MSDFHYVKFEYGEASIRKAMERDQLTDEDTALIREFVDELFSLRGISLSRRNKLIYGLVFWRKFLPAFRETTYANLTHAISQVRVAKNRRGGKYKQNTLHDHIVLIKRFFRWLVEKKIAHPSITPEGLTRIKQPSVKRVTKSPDELLTMKEIRLLIKNAGTPLYRAVICMLYEGGFRAKEIGTLTWNQVTIDQYGLAIRTDVKTDITRYVRLVTSKKHLVAWKRVYPGKASGNNFVFVDSEGNPLSHYHMLRQIRIIGRNAGIKRKITLHIFRHTRITHLVKKGIKEDVIKLMMWGNLKTDMFQTYAHLSPKDIDEIVIKMQGVDIKPLPKERPLAPRLCKHCGEINSPTFNYCGKCGREL